MDGLRIVQISDIHAGSFGDNPPIDKAIAAINKLKPDLVFFTGDLVNNTADEITPYIETFSEIQAKYGIYSILGNHDYGDYIRWDSMEQKSKNLSKLINCHKQLGWKLLNNQHEVIQINNINLAIIGVENISSNGRFSKYGNLTDACKGINDANIKLLLSHDPSHWRHEVILSFQDILMTFSGHTHGMQFWNRMARDF